MKILIFTTQFWKLGGAERLAIELAADLNRRGVHAELLSMYTSDWPGVEERRQRLLEEGIPAVRFLGMRVNPDPMSAFRAVLALRRIINDQKYDVVETSMVSPTFLTMCATLGLPTRHVAGIHDVFTKTRYNDRKSRLSRRFMRVNDRTRFYAISEYVKQHWIEYSQTLPERTRTIYNGVSNAAFEAVPERESVRKELRICPDARIVLFVGRMLKRKGIDTVMEALGPVLETENLHLVYVGALDEPPDGLFPDEIGLLDRMCADIDARGWKGRISMLGLRDDIPRLMASSDVLVHPARLEGFGLVLAEALATGLPVVASNVEGIPEVLSETDSLMVPPDDPTALRAAVQRTLQRTPLEKEVAERKDRARAERFRVGYRTDAMIALFENVLTGAF